MVIDTLVVPGKSEAAARKLVASYGLTVLSMEPDADGWLVQVQGDRADIEQLSASCGW